VLEAIRARRCYATSGVPIFLDVRAEGEHPMGAVIEAPRTSMRVRAGAASRLTELALIGPDGVLARVEPGAPEGALEANVEAPWSYVRVVTEDGEMAWSSPIFLSAR
jgi:hypothetical protein